jgi:predicted peptidase
MESPTRLIAHTLKALAAAAILAVCLGGCVSLNPFQGRSAETDGATGFVAKTMNVNGRDRRYVVYVPEGYKPSKEWPLIVFLHGASRRGNDNTRQTSQGLGPAILANPKRFPCLVLMPQCPEGMRWDQAADHIDTALDKTLREYNVDQQRVYLTGLSMGGFGTFYYGFENTERFAAFLPIAGGGRVDHAPLLAMRPLWVFHNQGDEVVSVERSRAMVDAINAAHGHVTYTEFPDDGHDAWTKAYNDEDVIKWLLKQRQ